MKLLLTAKAKGPAEYAVHTEPFPPRRTNATPFKFPASPAFAVLAAELVPENIIA